MQRARSANVGFSYDYANVTVMLSGTLKTLMEWNVNKSLYTIRNVI